MIRKLTLKGEGTRITTTVLKKKNEAGGVTLLNVQARCVATINKTDREQNLEVNPCRDKGEEVIQWRKDSLFRMVLEQLSIHGGGALT